MSKLTAENVISIKFFTLVGRVPWQVNLSRRIK